MESFALDGTGLGPKLASLLYCGLRIDTEYLSI